MCIYVEPINENTCFICVRVNLGVTGHFIDRRTKKPSNALFIRPQEVRELEFIVYEDSTHGRYSENVHGRSIWDNYGFSH